MRRYLHILATGLKRLSPVAAFVIAVGLVALTPSLVGMSWSAVGAVLSGLSAMTLVALAALWLSGLVVHTIVLTAALPGLSSRRALLLNLSGSAVSNLLPFGGAAGMGWGYVMARAWKISPTSFAAFTVISNIWNVVGKLLVGTALVGGAVIMGANLPLGLRGALLAGSVTVLVLVFVVVAVARSASVAARVGRGLDTVGNRVLRIVGSTRVLVFEQWLVETRAETSATVAAGWKQLTLGVVVYLLLQALLLAACLLAVGAHVSLLVVAVGFGLERILTVVPFTPGGSGFAELGTVAILIALGGSAAPVTAGVLLYRFYSHVMEIPVGGAGGLVWMNWHRRDRQKAVFA